MAFSEHVELRCPLAKRLESVLLRITDICPTAYVHEIEGIEAGFPGARIVMENGADVVVGVDLDRPAELFEVVRLYEPGESPKHPFEMNSTNGFASTEKLTEESVLKLLGWYAAACPSLFPKPRVPRSCPA